MLYVMCQLTFQERLQSHKDVIELPAFSECAATLNGPDINQCFTIDNMEIIVKVHGRITMWNDEIKSCTQQWLLPAGWQFYEPMFVAVGSIDRTRRGCVDKSGQRAFGGKMFVSAIARHTPWNIPAYH